MAIELMKTARGRIAVIFMLVIRPNEISQSDFVDLARMLPYLWLLFYYWNGTAYFLVCMFVRKRHR